MRFIKEFMYDYKRYGGEGSIILHHFRFLIWLRISQVYSNPIIRAICKIRMKLFSENYGLEISPNTRIGRGLYLGHPFNITINPGTIIGENVNIHKGVTIGAENRGKRKGTPVIGDKVWIGVNSSIVGSITIGNNVMIAPNTFVNMDIPSNSIVFGNPCIVKDCIDATNGYINNVV